MSHSKGLSAATATSRRARAFAREVPGRNRFAYVSHRLTDDIIEVWCSGDVEKLRGCQGIDVRPRSRIRDKGWEKQFPARFEVYNDQTLAAAVQCLLGVSYPAS